MSVCQHVSERHRNSAIVFNDRVSGAGSFRHLNLSESFNLSLVNAVDGSSTGTQVP
jgi:hypothetical protein